MAPSSTPWMVTCLVLLITFASPAHAFGAGNIGSTSQIEGQNWRHGDIEDTLLTLLIARAAGGKKFSKLDVKRVYFGNWLRDYSQAVDVGTVKYVSAEAIRILLWVLGFMSFGYGTKEFEVTTERLGCYRPEEHIDNPKDYADNLDARDYDRRLRGPVDERRELSIDPNTGLKSYIASEHAGITTSAGLVRNLFGRAIQLGRQYARSKNESDLFEALRLLGTGCHCLEDYSAHSNYTELALIELGEREVFPHVGRQTQINLRGARHPVYPIVTGTFGGVDFLHSVMGEFSDKATQSEIQELEGTIEQSQNSGQNLSVLQSLLSKLPDGMFGGEDQAGKADELQANAQAAQMQNMRVSPRQPEEWTRYLEDVQAQIRPILEFHDNLMKSITETVEKIPILPDLIDQISDQISIFIFSLLAPFVLPIINQVKTELSTGSSEVIKSSQEKQLIVFRDDRSTDPTHSMLSKDHFSNILNEPAGKVASQVLKWVVPQVIAAMDDERIDINRTLNRIITGVLHHPVLRDQGEDGATDGRHLMFQVVQKWWQEKDESERSFLRDALSRDGVEHGRNHKEGVHDSGHGCGKPLALPKTGQSSGGPASAVLGGLAQFGSELGGSGGQGPSAPSGGFGNIANDAVGSGVFGGLVGGLVGGVGSGILGGVFGGDDEKDTPARESHSSAQAYTASSGWQARGDQGGFGQAQYSRTERPSGVSENYQRFEQSGGYTDSSYEVKERFESRSGGFGGTSNIYGGGEDEFRREGRGESGEYSSETRRYGGKQDSDSDDEYKKEKHKKHHKKQSHDGSDNGDQRWQHGGQQETYGQGGGGYGGSQRREEEYGERESSRYEEPRYGERESSSRYEEPRFGGRESSQYEEPRYGGRETSSYQEPRYGQQSFNEQESADDRRGFGGYTRDEPEEGYEERPRYEEESYEDRSRERSGYSDDY